MKFDAFNFQSTKLLCMKADYHCLHPVRKEFASESVVTNIKSYQEERNKLQEQFGSAKQQRILKNKKEKGTYSHGDDIDKNQKVIALPKMKNRSSKRY
jgi:hypothetical protein